MSDLPSPPPRPPRRGPVPWGLIGLVGLVLAVESYVAGRPLDFTDMLGWEYRYTARALAGPEARESPLLCLGDSQVKFGVAPGVLEARGAPRAYNLSISGALAPATYLVFRRALEAGARPAAILVNCKPSSAAGHLGGRITDLPELLTPRDCLDLARQAGDGVLLVRLLALKLPTALARGEIRAQVVAALDGRDASLRDGNLGHLRNRAVNRGGLLAAKNPAFDGTIPPDQDEVYTPRRWRVDPVTDRSIRRLLALADRHGISVYWLIPPVVPEARSRRVALGLDDQYTEYLRTLQRGHPGLVVLDARGSAYPATAFYDPCHLDRDGAAAFSASVADALRAPPAGPTPPPRWVDLPAYRPPSVDLALEDSEQSRRAVELRPRR